jgi:hypothetical protein
MAVKGSGLGAGPDPAMVDQAKKAQTSFAVKDGMKDQNAPSGVTSSVGPIHPGKGPDASAADVMDPESPADRGKVLRKQPGALIPGPGGSGSDFTPGTLKASWGQKGGMGQDVDNALGGKVLGEAILSGATALPASVTANSGPAAAYNGKDPN